MKLNGHYRDRISLLFPGRRLLRSLRNNALLKTRQMALLRKAIDARMELYVLSINNYIFLILTSQAMIIDLV